MPSALTGPPVSSFDEVVARMQAIDAELDPADGLACFNRMYLQVTQLVRQRTAQHAFADEAWMTALDLTFANLYLDAVRASVQDPADTPRAWAPLLQHRTAPGVAAIQFAVAGMNAHINHDLPVAVVATCLRARSSPDTGSHHADYTRIDPVLDATERDVRQSFEHGDVLRADRRVAGVADVVGNWSITEARAAAWTNARVLWHLHAIGPLEAAFLDALAGSVGLASRGLLVALP